MRGEFRNHENYEIGSKLRGREVRQGISPENILGRSWRRKRNGDEGNKGAGSMDCQL